MERSPATNDSWTGFVARAKQLVKRPQGEIPSPRWAMSMRRRQRPPTLEAFYQFSFVAHAPWNLRNTTAWMHDGILEMWCPSQNRIRGATRLRARSASRTKKSSYTRRGRRWFRQAVDD